jgi:predicted dehydrogenase
VTQRRIRVGVIGAGRFAVDCHIPGLQAHPRAEVVALSARNRDRVTALAHQFAVPEVYTDYRELLARPDLDAVTVATPDALHHEVTMAALAAGKHVFCEKPLAMSVEEAQAMTNAAVNAGLVGMTAFTFRYTHALITLRRMLREGAIGTPFHVAMQVHWGGPINQGDALTWRDQSAHSAGGIWADGGSHLFDALAYVLAPVQEICAQMIVVQRDANQEQPDSPDFAQCLARLRLTGSNGKPDRALSGFADREQGIVHVSILTSRVDLPRQPSNEIQVLGTHGALNATFSRGENERLSMIGGDDDAWREMALPADANSGEPLALTRMMGAFVDAVERGRLDPEQDPGFDAGLHTQRALDAGVRSARNGRWVPV